MKNNIVVIGSANMDLVATTKTFPQPGETVFGTQFGMFPGGKGANQAVCCAKLGGAVQFVGKMGNDIFRDRLKESMQEAGIDLSHLFEDENESTGIALILVEGSAQNEIVVISGSNMKLTPEDMEKKKDVIAGARVLLLQLEIPVETVLHAVEIGSDNGVGIILNPAPACKLTDELLEKIDFLTPNETEMQILTGIEVDDVSSANTAARILLDKGVKNVIVTLGKGGCLWVHNKNSELFPAKEVKAVDTTAAGDAFNGAFAYALASENSIAKAIQFANKVAAFSVTKMGAQSSMPNMRELENFY